MPRKPSAPRQERPTNAPRREKITEAKMLKILERARQTVKPIINREAANEVVGEDILNFRMKA
jgi:hypothetical protein